MSEERLLSTVKLLKEEMMKEIEHPEVVLEGKRLVDELSAELIACTEKFVEKNRAAFKGSPVLTASILNRSFAFMYHFASSEWCMDAVAFRVAMKLKNETVAN